MTLTGASRSTGRQNCGSATVPIIKLTWTYLGSNTGIQGDRPATTSLNHSTACCILITGCLCPSPYRPQQGVSKVVLKFSAAL